MKYPVMTILWLLGLISPALGTVYLVEPDGTGDFPTIQAAIDAVDNGDIIELADGTFTGPGNRDLSFLGKPITVRSLGDDPELCIIDCEGSESDQHSGVYFNDGEDNNTILRGVTITGGWSSSGGIRCNSEPRISNCIISNNHGEYGGGIGAGGSLIVENCLISNNHATDEGGGIYANTSSIVIRNCVIANNYGELGGGLFLLEVNLDLDQCTIVNNDAEYGSGAIQAIYECELQIDNTIIAFNYRASIRTDGTGLAELACSDIFGNAGYNWGGGASKPGPESRAPLRPIRCSAISPPVISRWSICHRVQRPIILVAV